MGKQLGGIKVGDYIVEIAGHDAKWFTQAQILEKIRFSMNTLDLKVITPMIYPKPVSFDLFFAQNITLVLQLCNILTLEEKRVFDSRNIQLQLHKLETIISAAR